MRNAMRFSVAPGFGVGLGAWIANNDAPITVGIVTAITFVFGVWATKRGWFTEKGDARWIHRTH